MYYKQTTIINYASSVINKLETLLTDDTRVVIYDRHVFIVQATGSQETHIFCELSNLSKSLIFEAG